MDTILRLRQRAKELELQVKQFREIIEEEEVNWHLGAVMVFDIEDATRALVRSAWTFDSEMWEPDDKESD